MAMNTGNFPNTVALNGTEWRLVNRLGSGGFAEVYLAQSSWGEEIALKFIPKLPGADRELLFEELNGVRNVIPVIFRQDYDGFYVIGMPKADVTLRSFIEENGGRLPVEDAIPILLDIANSLEEMRKVDVVHRDIKPENVLFFNGTWCLADFGIARYAADTTAPDTRKFAQTDGYAAPEQWRGERATYATDVYATGIIAYEMLAGRRPFEGEDLRSLHLEAVPDHIGGIPVALQSLISWCLNKSPGSRPTPTEISVQMERCARVPTPNVATPLQRANQQVVTRLAETSRKESAIEAEIERRKQLFNAAKIDLVACVSSLLDAIRIDAPMSQVGYVSPRPHQPPIAADPQSNGFDPWVENHHALLVELNGARLFIEPVKRVPYPDPDLETDPPLRVVATSGISVMNNEPFNGYGGRGHALLYCDVTDEGRFRWFETGFMTNPKVVEIMGRESILPFNLVLGRETYDALSSDSHRNARALPFTPVDQSSQTEFVTRWVGYFGKAANGELRPPQLSAQVPL